MTKHALLVACIFTCQSFLSAQPSEIKVTSTDHPVSLSIPATWDSLDLNKSAVLQYGSQTEDVYVIVLNDNKADLNGWNLDRHGLITIGGLLKNVSSPTIEGPNRIAVNGFPAMQCRIDGATNGQNVTYLLTDIETSHAFSYVLCWTVKSRAEHNWPKMLKIVASFGDPDAP